VAVPKYASNSSTIFKIQKIQKIYFFENIQIENIPIENIQIENIQIENIQIENIQIENIQIENIQIENIQIENIQIENSSNKQKEKNLIISTAEKYRQNIDNYFANIQNSGNSGNFRGK
jgi:uncharacterized protein YjbI with pentapeptide repeats